MFFNSSVDQQIMSPAKNDPAQKGQLDFSATIGQITKIGLQAIQFGLDLMMSLVQLDQFEKAKLEQIRKFKAL